MADLVEDIKSRLGIEDVVSQYVTLKKAGRNFKGLCPFHSEKTPSFIVSPEKQICHCFGCNKGGDIFSFVEEMEGVSFVEALELLADRAGLKADLSKYRKKVDKTERDEYFAAHELACEFFENQLLKTDDGKKVLEYLYKRGLKDETVKEFRLGFAPDKYDELYPLLLKKGVKQDILLKSGLAAGKRLVSDEIYDKYRARLIFPIFDYLGKVCGFGGRALKTDQAPKYLNSAENPIYNKSKVLYGLSHAKQSVKEKDNVVLVEGYFDVILPSQEGVKNIVATSGVALTDDQARIIKRLTSSVTTCFDSDQAGFDATKRAYFVLQNQDVSMKTVLMKEKDPADFVLENGSKFQELVNSADDFVNFFIDKLMSAYDVNLLSGRQAVIKELAPCYKGMSPVSRDYFVRELSGRLNIKERYLYEEMNNLKLPADHPARVISGSGESSLVKISVSDLFLAILFEYPKLFGLVTDLVREEDFSDEMKDVYKEMLTQYNQLREKFEVFDFEKSSFLGVKEKFTVLRLYVEQKYESFSEDSLEEELGKLVDKMKVDRKIKQLKELQLKISEAEQSENKETLKDLLKEQQSLLNT